MPPIKIKELKKWITKEVGKQCKDYHPMCYVCRWWATYKELEAIVIDYQDTEAWVQEQMKKDIKKK